MNEKNISYEKLKTIVETSNSKKEVLEKLSFPNNGKYRKKLNEILNRYNLTVIRKPKYEKITKTCPVCGIKFITLKNHPREERTTCSYSCSNTFFRSGKNNPNFKGTQYRTICFIHHKKECVVCGEDRIVEVHHFDNNKRNNDYKNLVPLCPTHHQILHSRYKNDIYDIVLEYVKNVK